MMNNEHPKWLPYWAYIATNQINSDERLKSQDTIKNIYDVYGGKYLKNLDTLYFKYNSTLGFIRRYINEDMHFYLISLGSGEENKYPHGHPIFFQSYKKYDEYLQNLKELLPENLLSKYMINLFHAHNQENAKEILHEYLEKNTKSLRSAGYVRGCLLATLEKAPNESIDLIIIPYEKNIEYAVKSVWTLLLEIVDVSIYIEEMNSLYTNRKLTLDQMDASEGSIQIWINRILGKMRRSVDDIQPEDLENILKEITIQFSRLSTLSSTVRRDQVKAEGLSRSLSNLLKKWNEKPIAYYQPNFLVEIEHFDNLKAKFGDFLEKIDALMTQLDILLDSVRTYLGIKQQKLSILEQSSSASARAKLEILIVAVYLTEIARIVFETLQHEKANLLTAFFIPIALLISFIIYRLLHRPHSHARAHTVRAREKMNY